MGDVLNGYDQFGWKLPGDNSDIPQVHVKAYKMNGGIHSTNINAILNGATSKEPYSKLYDGTEVKEFIFPYIITSGSELYHTSQEWKQSQNDLTEQARNLQIPAGAASSGVVQSLMRAAGGVTGAVNASVAAAKMVSNFVNNGTGTEPISMYYPTATTSVTISFPLYNTINPEYCERHWNFVTEFNKLCLKKRTSFFTYEFPCMFAVRCYSKGALYMPITYCSQYSVGSIGPTKEINGKLLPEAYIVKMTFTELITNSVNIFEASLNGGAVSVL
jgi:hypothetical protein